MIDKNIGILGGGQLGKMINTAASSWHIPISYLDNINDSPVADFSNSVIHGDYRDYDDVLNFGMNMDILGIEIEHVNTKALLTCEALGKEVYPAPVILDIIKNKNKQFTFYKDNGFPVPSFKYYSDGDKIISDLKKGQITYPFVQKSTGLGYDGKGVVLLKSELDLVYLLKGETLIQNHVSIKKELAIILARNKFGEIKTYEPVEMLFDSNANLLERLICPAQIEMKILKNAIEMARDLASKMNLIGLLAVEMFLDDNDQLWINEVAPRPHNSGHHTIEASVTSQYEQYLRCVLSLPLGSTKSKSPYSVMINLLGTPGHKGKAIYNGLTDFLNQSNVYIHLYGKKETRPYRKMGHVTILCNTLREGIKTADLIKKQVSITTK